MPQDVQAQKIPRIGTGKPIGRSNCSSPPEGRRCPALCAAPETAIQAHRHANRRPRRELQSRQTIVAVREKISRIAPDWRHRGFVRLPTGPPLHHPVILAFAFRVTKLFVSLTVLSNVVVTSCPECELEELELLFEEEPESDRSKFCGEVERLPIFVPEDSAIL